MIISHKKFSVYFGDTSTSYKKKSLHGSSQEEIMQLPGYKEFCEKNVCEKLIILEQVHGTQGFNILQEKDAHIKPYSVNGDYILTHVSGVALAIETADCVPLLLVDIVNPCVCAVHAGWRGAVSGVVTNAVRDMLKLGSLIENIQAYFGPAARGCCYEVSPDFLDKFENGASNPYFTQRGGKLYFDNVSLIVAQLLKRGLAAKNILTDYADCTVCYENYCSFRRQHNLDLRQMTIVALK